MAKLYFPPIKHSIKPILSVFFFLILLSAKSFSMKVGDTLPKFEAITTDGKINSDELKGRWVVIFFYPKAFTPGCTKQVCSVQSGYRKLIEKFNVRIIGVSRDKLEKQKKFKEKYKLEYELIADEDGKIVEMFGVKGMLGMAKRKTFIISPEGKIVYIFDEVNVKEHHKEIEDALNKLASKGE